MKYEQLSEESKAFVDSIAESKNMTKEEVIKEFVLVASGKKPKKLGLFS